MAHHNADPKLLANLSWKFLPVALLFRASNWLQGPYFYKLYSSKNSILQDLPGGMTTLYVSGYVAGMTAGTLIGSFTDRCGRRNGCVLCGLAFAFTCLTAHSNNLWVLLFGRLTAGIASTLLHSAFEAWLVSEATRIGGAEQKLSLVSSVLSSQTSMSSFIAIISGAVATYAVNAVGVTGASDLALCLLFLGLILMFATWRENVGVRVEAGVEESTNNDESRGGEKVQGSGSRRRSAMSVLTSHPSVIALGVVQVAYEGTMHIFITLWPEILQETVEQEENVPFGYIFSGFMVSVMVGSALYKSYTTRVDSGKTNNNVIACAVMLFVATVALFIPFFSQGHFWATLVAFVLFEATAGGYHPCMGAMRTRLVPSDVSASMITLFRVPQNMLVVTLLLSYKKESHGKGRATGSGIGQTHLLAACSGVLCLSLVVLLVVFGTAQSGSVQVEKEEAKKKNK